LITEAQDELDKSKENVDLTNLLREDSANMKIIAILTALFLPGTFMAVRSPLPIFHLLNILLDPAHHANVQMAGPS
jgi:hypothetical protein